MIYLDYNATTPLASEVIDSMDPFIHTHFGNPSSSHKFGIIAKQAVEKARSQVANLINCTPQEIVFTSGGTESNNYAIKGTAQHLKHKGNHIITSQTEHPAVLEVCTFLNTKGFEITIIPVDKYGMVNPADIEREIKPSTILISIMHANNETGTIQPVDEIGNIAKKHNVLFHSDAAQSLGKTPVDVQKTNVDMLSIAGHKIYAPKGIGAIYIKNGVAIDKIMHGANHEQNRRAGTENVAQIVGLGKACELISENLHNYSTHYQETRDRLFNLIKKEIPEVKLNGHPNKRLPNTLNISFPGIQSDNLLSKLENIAVSAGSACHADKISVSHVIEAMQVPLEFAMGTIRISTGRANTIDEMEKAASEIITAIKAIKAK